MLNDYFKLFERKTNFSVEFFAGLTTFLTMGYIIFLQPAILSGGFSSSPTGMDSNSLITTTCIVSGVGCLLMGFLANYPVALAPGMGENFFFVSVVGVCAAIPGITGDSAWQTALTVVFVSGILFVLITLLGLRKFVLGALSPSMQHAIAGGIGLFIAYLGLKNGTIIQASSNGLFISNDIKSKAVLIFFVGFIVTCALKILKYRGYIIWGIFFAAILAIALGEIKFVKPFSAPPSPFPLIGKLNFSILLQNIKMLFPLIIIFLFMDMFDTLGTLVGVCSQANLMEGNKLANSEKAFLADAFATLFGAFCGHSTVTSYIESASGVEYGGRSGLTAIFAGFFFFASIFFAPLIKMIAEYPPITAPALVIIGAMMLKNISNIKWDEIGEAAPAFLTLIGIPFTSSISDGLTLGIVSYPIINFFGGNGKKVSYTAYIISFLMIVYLLFVRTK